MNYFIDFEATQFSNEIISIGCVRENGDEFYSEVRASKKITPFITSLTGITDEENKSAAGSDDVFARFFDWLSEHKDSRAVFYCYGNTDINFVKRNLDKTNNIKAQAALSIIGMNLYDYSKKTKSHFGLIKNISLIKLVAYYRHVESVAQAHNALEDAKYLKYVFKNVESEAEVDGHPFPEYEQEASHEKSHNENAVYKMSREELKRTPHKVFAYNVDGVLEGSFDSLIEARKWVFNKLGRLDRAVADKRKIENKIVNSHLNNKPYRGFDWRIIVFKEE